MALLNENLIPVPDISFPRERTKVVSASSYTTTYYKLDYNLMYFQREHAWTPGTREVDAFGRVWSLAITNLASGTLAAHRKGRRIELAGLMGIFIPPFSIVEWEINKDFIVWQGYLSESEIPSDLPSEPVAFPWRGPLPVSLDQVFAHVRESENKIAVGKLETPSKLAKRTRQLMTQNIWEPLSIKDISESLGCSHAAMTRAFKKAYGITPVGYRNKMRIFDAAGMLALYDQAVNHTAHALGFKHLRQFNKQFKRYVNAAPSQYRGPDQ
ncbi:MAG: helix-turn-helix transcriptional regulator [Pseudobdellovibrionaceae bacterium]|nr:helix-turn-helix transcriptional regulator [Bdellovibrionales bacterium]USN48796.1 MAG: helix-turn-helix transcriptional regulator [Pseudobdellovibrionaceae bacterium]